MRWHQWTRSVWWNQVLIKSGVCIWTFSLYVWGELWELLWFSSGYTFTKCVRLRRFGDYVKLLFSGPLPEWRAWMVVDGWSRTEQPFIHTRSGAPTCNKWTFNLLEFLLRSHFDFFSLSLQLPTLFRIQVRCPCMTWRVDRDGCKGRTGDWEKVNEQRVCSGENLHGYFWLWVSGAWVKLKPISVHHDVSVFVIERERLWRRWRWLVYLWLAPRRMNIT